MAEPEIPARHPVALELEPGTYYWCSCGKSKTQPFCDGSQAGTGIEPVAFRVEEAGPYWLCACKHTANPPFCDGAHDLLED